MLRKLFNLLCGGGWVQGVAALDAQLRSVHPLDSRAESWCLLAGIQYVAWQETDPLRREVRFSALLAALTYVEPAIQVRTPGIFNDTESQDVILNVIHRAVEVQEDILERL